MQVAKTLELTLRTLRRRPGFSAVAVLTVGLALAAAATVFGVVHALLLAPLPFRDARELVTLDVISRQGYGISTSIPNWRDWRDASRVFATYGGAAGWDFDLTGQGEARKVDARAVVGDFFGVLGVDAALGRTLRPAETEPGAPAVAVVGNRFWREVLGADPHAVGRVIDLDERPYTVVGVMPRGFGYPTPDTDLYVPMGSIPGLPWDDRDSAFGTRAFARLAPGVTLAAAQSDLDRVQRQIEEAEGGPQARPVVRTLRSLYVGELRPRLWLLTGAVACVVLIAAANLASLLLSRGEARRREVAVRRALGAGRGALFREMVAEGVTLALAGGVLGLGLAGLGIQAIQPLLPGGILSGLVAGVGVDGPVALATLAVALAVGLGASLVPVLRDSHADLAGGMKQDGPSTAGGRRSLRSALVVVEVALSLVLLIAAGLMIESLRSLRRVDLGFDPASTLTARIGLPDRRYPDKASWRAFFEELEARAARIPGVRSSALTLLAPLAGRSWELRIHPEGESLEEEGRSVLYGIVTPGYFETLEVPILRGRAFDAGDRDGTEPVAIIDRTMAESFWPGADPIGRRVLIDGETTEDGSPYYRTVVGVAANVRHYEVESPSRIQVYVPFQQSHDRWGMSLHVALRSTVPPETLVAPLQAAVAAIDPEVPLYDVTTLAANVDDALSGARAVSTVLAGFWVLALVLAAVGIFGVISYLVAQRLREIGVRMALGADGRRILRWVFTWVAGLAGLGVALGLVGAAGATRLLGSFLFEVSPLDPELYAGLGLLVFAIALLAALVPARRATRVDPVTVLRSDG